MRGLNWLADIILQGELSHAWPIGFYFAKLWYYERLYPAIFSLGALGAAIRSLDETNSVAVGY
jgi:squalene-hopene/tetraprenyl-beta-curcumene cyclase